MKKNLIKKMLLIAMLAFNTGFFMVSTNKAYISEKYNEEDNVYKNFDETRKLKLSNINDKNLNEREKIEFIDNFQEIQNEVNILGIDVKEELEKKKEYYNKEILKTRKPDEKNELQLKIDSTNYLINEYNDFSNNSLETNNLSVVADNAVSLALSIFSSRGYTLAYELLEHMYINNELNSIYKPSNGYLIRYSKTYKDILKGNKINSKAEFPKTGNSFDDDLYHAISSFNFKLSESKRAFVLTDRYDFDFRLDYEFVTGIGNNIMYGLQKLGQLTPYYVVIELENNLPIKNPPRKYLYLNNNPKFENLTLAKGEYQEYNLTFTTSGYKNLQTTGYNDTYLELYDTYGNKLAYNDDGGYEANAFIKYYFSAYRTYILKVRFYSSYKLGDIQLLITPSSESSFSSISEIEKEGWWIFGAYKKKVYKSSNEVRLYKFTPENKKTYTIETSNYYNDPYLYLVDPRLPFFIDYGNKYNANAKDDDSGKGLRDAKITKELAKKIPYIIIAASYNLNYYDEYDINIR